VKQLYYGDNLSVLRESIKDETIDLVYLDPPFNSQASYNVLFKAPTGEQSHAQIEAFEDSWHWGESAEQAFDAVMSSGNTDAAELLRAMRSFLKENDMMAYLTMIAIRLLELHRVIKPTGSLYLHCDPTASHYLKLLLDAAFGPANFRNEIVWKRTHAHGSSRRFGPVHDILLFYSKSENYLWTDPKVAHDPEYIKKHFKQVDDVGRRYQPITLTGSGIRHGESGRLWRGIDPTKVGRHWALPGDMIDRLGISVGSVQERLDALDAAGLIYWPDKKDGTPRLKWFADELKGAAIPDVWTEIPPISANASERLGYPTQKPVALLERVVSASSKEGDIVLDPFCGCGTTIHAAQKLNRRWIGIDITHLAISLIEKRLNDAFPGIKYEVHGTPKDLEGARDLAARDKYQFQWWAISLVKAIPFSGKKKGADSGIDGVIYFKDFTKKGKVLVGSATEKIIVSVKGGDNVGVSMIRDLAHVVDRENAKMGLFITLAEPTDPMRIEAVKEGYFESPGLQGKYPKLQIITIGNLLAGKMPELLPMVSLFAQAPQEAPEQRTLGV
jgi:site-specific DNA-methyltransferase (adenine-specific)